MINRYPMWKYVLLVVLIAFGVIYSLPNVFGNVPALQISSSEHGVKIDESVLQAVKTALVDKKIKARKFEIKGHDLYVQFSNTDLQAQAQEVVENALGSNYIVALYLQPTTPAWLASIGANPMRLGLDLQGGVHFLLSVDVDSVFKHRTEGDSHNIAQSLRGKRIRYSGIATFHKEVSQGVIIKFRDEATLQQAAKEIETEYHEYTWEQKDLTLVGTLAQNQYQQVRQNTMDQSMTILRNRVNELGISEAVVTQQGADQISVDLPGIQDAAQAQNIIGKTATLEFHLVDMSNDPNEAAASGIVPAGDILEYNESGRPFLLKRDIILKGSSVTNANSNYGDQGAEVEIRLAGGSDVTKFNRLTAQNIGRLLAVLYVETKPVTKEIDGKKIVTYKTEKRVINAATIQAALGNSFRITGLTDMQEARNLALLLRAGALPVPIHIAQERTIGPSLGAQNIKKGILSVEIGFAIVIIFMAIYYQLFGVIADIALGLNLFLIVAVMSLLGAVMTLPGIAGIVLTVGMAVDANVLIFERIREEIRHGVTLQASIYAGYERAMTTIIDANVTTLIVAIVLFSLGSGPVKGFAVTLTIGLITSMITAIFGTRAIVNLIYGGRTLKQLSIGMKVK